MPSEASERSERSGEGRRPRRMSKDVEVPAKSLAVRSPLICVLQRLVVHSCETLAAVTLASSLLRRSRVLSRKAIRLHHSQCEPSGETLHRHRRGSRPRGSAYTMLGRIGRLPSGGRGAWTGDRVPHRTAGGAVRDLSEVWGGPRFRQPPFQRRREPLVIQDDTPSPTRDGDDCCG